MIETLDQSHREEVLDVLGAAFSQHPLLPPDPSGGKARLMVKAILDAFRDAPDANTFGIRKEGRICCAAFVYDAAYEPRGLRLIQFLLRMVRIAGWRMTRTFAEVLSETPKSEDRRLEFMLLGTRSADQKSGLGRRMMHHVLSFACDRGYESVVLGVAKATPAHGFYLREGFQLEKEVPLPKMPLCLLRRPLADDSSS